MLRCAPAGWYKDASDHHERFLEPQPVLRCAPAGWYKDAFGIVHLEGAVSQLTIPNGPALIPMLPPATRPNREVFEIVHTLGGHAPISRSGRTEGWDHSTRPPAQIDPRFVSLEVVSYQPADQIPSSQWRSTKSTGFRTHAARRADRGPRRVSGRQLAATHDTASSGVSELGSGGTRSIISP